MEVLCPFTGMKCPQTCFHHEGLEASFASWGMNDEKMEKLTKILSEADIARLTDNAPPSIRFLCSQVSSIFWSDKHQN